MFCVDLPIHDANHTFCGISTEWKPRINRFVCILICVVFALLAWTFTLYVAIKLRRKIEEAYKNESSFSIFIGYLFFYGKMIWEAVDVTLDLYLFYQIEFGEIINGSIYRNSHVNNSILVFAILGSMKVFFLLQFEADDPEEVTTLKINQIWYVFLLEDGPELILEYFYIEKYVSVRPPWYILVRDIILVLISLHIIFNVIRNSCFDKKFWPGSSDFIQRKTQIAICYFITLIGVLMFLRVGGAGYQYVRGRLERDCFNVQDRKLLQSPFSVRCLREIDYAIIILSIILPIPSICFASLFFYYMVNPHRINFDQEYVREVQKEINKGTI